MSNFRQEDLERLGEAYLEAGLTMVKGDMIDQGSRLMVLARRAKKGSQTWICNASRYWSEQDPRAGNTADRSTAHELDAQENQKEARLGNQTQESQDEAQRS